MVKINSLVQKWRQTSHIYHTPYFYSLLSFLPSSALETKATIQKLADQYRLQFPTESESIKSFQYFLETNKDEQLYDRKNFKGHITASAFILNTSLDSLLLLKHKKLNRWLQPGGHVDESDNSLIAAVLRETREETGLAYNNLAVIDILGDNSIFDIDSHLIPESIKKNEPAHVHHDLRFLFKCLQPGLINLNVDEASGFKWVSLGDLKNDQTFGHVAQKIMTVTHKLTASS